MKTLEGNLSLRLSLLTAPSLTQLSKPDRIRLRELTVVTFLSPDLTLSSMVNIVLDI